MMTKTKLVQINKFYFFLAYYYFRKHNFSFFYILFVYEQFLGLFQDILIIFTVKSNKLVSLKNMLQKIFEK